MFERGVRWKMDSREKVRDGETSMLLDVGERKGKLIFRREGVRERLKFLMVRGGRGMEGS
jgi:hypothetical protein